MSELIPASGKSTSSTEDEHPPLEEQDLEQVHLEAEKAQQLDTGWDGIVSGPEMLGGLSRVQRGLLVLICLAALAAGFFYYLFCLLRKNNMAEIEVQFQADAQRLFDEVQFSYMGYFALLRSLATSVTSSALVSGDAFPYITVPYFEELASELLVATDFEVVQYAPYVPEQDLQQWQTFSGSQVDSNTEYHVYQSSVQQLKNAYMPIWQASPPLQQGQTSIVNYDLRSRIDMEHMVVDVIASKLPVLAGASDMSNFTTPYARIIAANPLHSYLMEPVFQTLKTGDDVTGVLIGIFAWDDVFLNRLPGNVDKIVVVVNDLCGSIFTYEVDGVDAKFVGMGDLHNPAYSNQRVSYEFADKYRFTRGAVPHMPKEGLSYDDYFRDTPLGHCAYTMDIYPTSDYYKGPGDYPSLIFAAVVLGVFLVYFLVSHKSEM